MSEYQSKHTGQEIDDGIDEAKTALQPGDVVDNLTSTDVDKPLSANQGKALKDSQVSVGDIVNNLTSTATDRPLAAAQGKTLQDTKAAKARQIIAGTGLDGGGDLTANRTLGLSSATQASLSAADTALQPGDPATDVSYDGEASGLAATDVQGAIDEAVESLLGRKEQIAQGFIQREQTRGDLDVDLAVAIALNLIGAPVAGGFYAGIIDTIKGDIQTSPADAYQTGLRYALIVSPQSLEAGPGLRWFTSNSGTNNDARTRWNGLEATDAILALEDSGYEAHDHIADVRASDPPPATPGGSDWYMPAMDELELLYRNFKPNNADNFTDDRSATFPGNQVQGTNPSSDPQGSPYANGPRIPDETFLALFKQSGGVESLSQLRYWTSTEAQDDRAWNQFFTNAGREGGQGAANKTSTSRSVRPVRRVVL